MISDQKTLRVLHVRPLPDGGCEITALSGGQEFTAVLNDSQPQPGDVYRIEGGDPLRLGEKLATALPQTVINQGDVARWNKRDARGISRRAILEMRQTIRKATRAYMESAGFLEIEVPLLVHGTTPDSAIGSFQIKDRYLSTSSELQLRRLEIGGFERVYSFTKNFRLDDGDGPTRNPEFTMLEWVRVGDTMDAIERDVQNILLQAHRDLGGTGTLQYRGHRVDLTPPWDVMTVKEAVRTHVGYHLKDFTAKSFAEALDAAQVTVQSAWVGDAGFLFSLLLDTIQAKLGFQKPLWLRDWPAFETSSANANSEVADRSELLICGLELCNGFPSFSDYATQIQTFEFQQKLRESKGMGRITLDDYYLESMKQGLPPDAGMALGFDRMAMLLTGADDIRQTLAFAWDEV